MPGDRVGPLCIERLLGAGSMGEVYLARDTRLERLVALKMMVDSEAGERMLREARAASGLRHPGIVTVYDIGEHEGQTYIAMEYVEGETFEALVARRGPLPAAEAVALMAQVGDALATAHEAGILHRDIKSANLMVDERGRTKVLDFGLCKLTRASDPGSPAELGSREAASAHASPPEPASPPTVQGKPRPSEPRITAGGEPQTEAGTRMGTPGWAPPELMEGRPADARSDVYSLGVVLYHLLTGHLPFPGYNWEIVRMQIGRGPALPSRLAPSIPPLLDALLVSALAVEPDRRPASVRDLVARAGSAVAGKRRRRIWWTLLAAPPVAAGAIIALAHGSGGAPDEPAAGSPAASSPPERLAALGGCASGPVFVDRETVVFDLARDGRVDLYRIDLDGRAPVRLTTDPGRETHAGPGRRAGEVAFLRRGASGRSGDAGALEALDLASGARSLVLEHAEAFAFAGDALYYARGGELRRRRAEHDDLVLALPAREGIGPIAAAGDGSQLALVAQGPGGTKVCLVEAATGRMSCPVFSASGGRPALSPDRSYLYFHRRRRGGIARLRLPGGSREIVLPEADPQGGLAISPDGRAMVWSDCGVTSELIEVSAGGSRAVTRGAILRAPVFGPEGRLVYVRDRAGASELVVRSPDGTERELEHRSDARIGDVAISPEGDRIAFVLEDVNQPGLYLASLRRGTPASRLTEDAGDTRPVFVGDELVFTRLGRDGVPHPMRSPADGGRAQEVGRLPRETIGADGAGHRVLLRSPDRRSLYWWDPATGRESPGPPASPGSPSDVSDLALSGDGRWLLYLGGDGGQEWWRLRLDVPSQPELLHRLGDDLTADRGAIDPSGRAVIAVHRRTGDLWLARPPAGARW